MTYLTSEEWERVGKKAFFPERRTLKEARLDREQVKGDRDLVQRVQTLAGHEYLTIPVDVPLIPEEYQGPRHFAKYGDEIAFAELGEEAQRRLTPIDLYREAFAGLKEKGYYSSIQYSGFKTWGRKGPADWLTRIPLVELVKGDKFFTYTQLNPAARIVVGPYKDKPQVETRGGKFTLEFPSRTIGRHRYDSGVIHGVPVNGCEFNHVAWRNVNPEHSCKKKQNQLSFRHQHAHEWDAHDVGMLLHVMYAQQERGDACARKFSPIVRPTQATVDFFRTMDERVLIQRKKGRHTKTRYPTDGEMEFLLANFTIENGFDACWEAPQKELKLREYVPA